MSARRSLLLLSGLLCDSFVWTKVAQRMREVADITVVSFAGCNSMSVMADRVLAAAPRQFALAGHSMGGRVALEVFRRKPESISHLALLNTGAHPKREAEVGTRLHLLDIAERLGMAALADEWLPPMMSAAGRRDGTLMRHLRAMVLRHSAAEFRGQIEALLDRPDASMLLPQINVPTLLLSGDEDNWSPPSQHEEMQRQIPGSSLMLLPEVGHMSTVEAPQSVADALTVWLAK